jgi:hypothetical protein
MGKQICIGLRELWVLLPESYLFCKLRLRKIGCREEKYVKLAHDRVRCREEST